MKLVSLWLTEVLAPVSRNTRPVWRFGCGGRGNILKAPHQADLGHLSGAVWKAIVGDKLGSKSKQVKGVMLLMAA